MGDLDSQTANSDLGATNLHGKRKRVEPKRNSDFIRWGTQEFKETQRTAQRLEKSAGAGSDGTKVKKKSTSLAKSAPVPPSRDQQIDGNLDWIRKQASSQMTSGRSGIAHDGSGHSSGTTTEVGQGDAGEDVDEEAPQFSQSNKHDMQDSQCHVTGSQSMTSQLTGIEQNLTKVDINRTPTTQYKSAAPHITSPGFGVNQIQHNNNSQKHMSQVHPQCRSQLFQQKTQYQGADSEMPSLMQSHNTAEDIMNSQNLQSLQRPTILPTTPNFHQQQQQQPNMTSSPADSSLNFSFSSPDNANSFVIPPTAFTSPPNNFPVNNNPQNYRPTQQVASNFSQGNYNTQQFKFPHPSNQPNMQSTNGVFNPRQPYNPTQQTSIGSYLGELRREQDAADNVVFDAPQLPSLQSGGIDSTPSLQDESHGASSLSNSNPKRPQSMIVADLPARVYHHGNSGRIVHRSVRDNTERLDQSVNTTECLNHLTARVDKMEREMRDFEERITNEIRANSNLKATEPWTARELLERAGYDANSKVKQNGKVLKAILKKLYIDFELRGKTAQGRGDKAMPKDSRKQKLEEVREIMGITEGEMNRFIYEYISNLEGRYKSYKSKRNSARAAAAASRADAEDNDEDGDNDTSGQGRRRDRIVSSEFVTSSQDEDSDKEETVVDSTLVQETDDDDLSDSLI